jgi:hypothetical protein
MGTPSLGADRGGGEGGVQGSAGWGSAYPASFTVQHRDANAPKKTWVGHASARSPQQPKPNRPDVPSQDSTHTHDPHIYDVILVMFTTLSPVIASPAHPITVPPAPDCDAASPWHHHLHHFLTNCSTNSALA